MLNGHAEKRSPAQAPGSNADGPASATLRHGGIKQDLQDAAAGLQVTCRDNLGLSLADQSNAARLRFRAGMAQGKPNCLLHVASSGAGARLRGGGGRRGRKRDRRLGIASRLHSRDRL
jgi:hypothetical protein